MKKYDLLASFFEPGQAWARPLSIVTVEPLSYRLAHGNVLLACLKNLCRWGLTVSIQQGSSYFTISRILVKQPSVSPKFHSGSDIEAHVEGSSDEADIDDDVSACIESVAYSNSTVSDRPGCCHPPS